MKDEEVRRVNSLLTNMTHPHPSTTTNNEMELQQRLLQSEERFQEYEQLIESKNQEVAFAEQSLHEIQEELRKRTLTGSPQHDLIPSPSKDDDGYDTTITRDIIYSLMI